MGYWHAQAVVRAGGRVAAVIDRDPAAAQRLAAKLPGAHAYPSLDAASAEQPLDVLHVCTPTPSHVTLAGAGLMRGLHVLVEKPLAPSAAETGKLLDLAASQGVMLCPVHQFIFQQGVQAARRRLHALGRVVRLQVEIRSAGGEGAGAAGQDQLVVDMLPHCLSLAQFLLGGGVDKAEWHAVRPQPGELCVIGTLGSTVLVFDLSLHGRPAVNRCVLVGENGSLRLNLFHGYAAAESGSVSRTRKVLQPFAATTTELAAAAANLGRRTLRRQTAYPGLWELVSRFYFAAAQGTAAVAAVAPVGSVAPVAPVALMAPIAPADTLAVACARDAIIEESGL